MTYAALQNSDGEYILPSPDSIGRAVQNGTVMDPAVNGTMQAPPIMAVGQLGSSSYPVVGFYYVALADAPSTERAAASLDFARWISGSGGQRMLADVQYPSIYDQREELRALADALAAETQAPRFENATNLTENPNDSVYG
jgi:ABC-type phosphate transport system substrate-binding protein